MPDIRVKFCGFRSAGPIDAACAAGAAYIGFNFYPKSPRSVTPAEAGQLGARVPAGVAKVALVVNPGDEDLRGLLAAAPMDMIQLHGAEPPERVIEVKALTGLPVIKAVGIRDAGDLPALETYSAVADMLLVDAKPPREATLPGGNGLPFDWQLIAGRRWPVPWLLAGGLHAGNVAEAVARTGAFQVDLASGVETAPGVKDAGLIEAFMARVRDL